MESKELKNANEILFRCSSLGFIMTESRSKSDPISETTKSHLADKYVSARFGRQTDIHTKYMKKGLMVEEDSITLYSRVKKVFFKKNEMQIENGFICGTPDLFTGSIITEAETIIDIKSSWDIFTFFRTTQDKLNKMYYWQLQGYMALTGASSAKLVYCLVNTPEQLVFDEINKLKWKLGVINPETDENFKQATAEIEKAANYDDVPMVERVNEIHVERNDADIEKVYERVRQCREYMNQHLFKIKQPLEAVEG